MIYDIIIGCNCKISLNLSGFGCIFYWYFSKIQFYYLKLSKILQKIE